MTTVINYFISIQSSIDPIWWDCRWSDMVVYATTIKPNEKVKGCMSREEYPFNVWEFLESTSKKEFIETGIKQVMQEWKNDLEQPTDFQKFLTTFKNGDEVFLEDSVMWYALDMGVEWYLSLSIHERINFKQSYFDMADDK